MAIQFSNSLPPPSPSSPWKRFASEPPSFYPKRLKETSYVTNGNIELDALRSMENMINVGEEKVLLKERKRPARIEIPKYCMSMEFGDVGKKEGLVEEGFEVEGTGYWLACRKGTQHAMEDGYGVMTNINGDPKQALFGVFDGHGGRAAVDFVCENLGRNVIAALEMQHEVESLEFAVKAGYLATDTEFISQGVRSGACVATVLLRDGVLVAANVGDCRVVVSRNGVADAVTNDHRAGREDERIRIENTAGGYVSCNNGVWRVHGSLAVSRAIGDSSMKKWVISEPETSRLHLTPDYEFLIMASDGLWHTVSNQEAVDIVLKHKESLQSCKVLVDLASSRGSRDDITVIVVNLPSFL